MPETKAPPAAEPMPAQVAQTAPSQDASPNKAPAAEPMPMRLAQAAPSQEVSQAPVTPETKTAAVAEPAPVQTTEPATETTTPPANIVTPAASLTNPIANPVPAVASKTKTDEETINGQIEALMNGATPIDRHTAIRDLSANDWRKFPQILAAFVKSARVDSDRAVRVNAIRHLAALKMDIPYVVEHLKYMEKDPDGWVAQESKDALEKLHVAQ
jgi:hypothetical protein